MIPICLNGFHNVYTCSHNPFYICYESFVLGGCATSHNIIITIYANISYWLWVLHQVPYKQSTSILYYIDHKSIHRLSYLSERDWQFNVKIVVPSTQLMLFNKSLLQQFLFMLFVNKYVRSPWIIILSNIPRWSLR